jgi:hypothetical protein
MPPSPGWTAAPVSNNTNNNKTSVPSLLSWLSPAHLCLTLMQAADAAWTNWMRARASSGATWDDLQSGLKERYEATKGSTKQSWDEFSNQARQAYDEAVSSGNGHWWDSFSDRVACSWDNAKCRMKETLGMSAQHGRSAEEVRTETHRKVDELYDTATHAEKAEL